MESVSGRLIFAKHSFGISETETIAFSPFLKYFLRIISVSDQKEKLKFNLHIYSIDKNIGCDSINVTLIYHQQYLDSLRFVFSEEGKQLLICTNSCIYNFWFDENGIHKGSTIVLSELHKNFNIFKADFVQHDVEPVQLKNYSVTLCIDLHWLLSFQFSSYPVLSLNYCVEITDDVLYLQHIKNTVYCLTCYGKIFSYNINDGSAFNVFDVYSLGLPNTLNLEKFIVNSNNSKIALCDKSNVVYILDTPSTEQVESGCENETISIKSYRTSISHTSTYSKAESIRSTNQTKSMNRISSSSLPSWNSYLEKLHRHNEVRVRSQNKAFICINDLPENTVVKVIHFYSYSSIGVWCVSPGYADNFYRVYDCVTAEVEMDECLHSEIHVIPLNCPGISLDVFAGPTTLSVPLLYTSKEVLVNKLLNCVGSDCVSWLLELDKSLSQSMRPLSLLKDALKDSQLHLVKLSLNLHFQELKRELTDEVIDTTKTVMDDLIAAVNDSTTRESFSNEILKESLIYANRILSLLKSNSPLQVEILKRVVNLRSGLRKPQPLPVEDHVKIPQWSIWDVLSDKEIVKESVKDLPLVHCFLISRRNWSPEDISKGRFKDLVISIVTDFLISEHLKEAQDFLIQTGYNPDVEIPLICKNTLNRSLRDFLMTTLAEDEAEACRFIRIVERILDRYTFVNSLTDYSQGQLTLSNIMSYTSELKTQILTDLYFNTQDSTLLKYLKRDICWEYLLSYNSVENLRSWIDSQSQVLQWPVTQEMIDRVLEVDVSDYTKETVFNQLASYGKFSSAEKKSPELVLRRLACSKLSLQYRQILQKSTANLLCEDFDKMLLKYAVHHDLLDLVIMSLPSDISTEDIEERPGWFSLWKVFVNWEKEGVIRLLTETSSYLSESDVSSYLKRHPFVAIATDLHKNQEISRVHAYFSPIVAAIATVEPKLKDVTLYSLLAGTIPFYTDNLFQFQPDQNKLHKDFILEMPDFTNEELSKKYGRNQSLRFTDRLKQGRPSQALIQLYDQNGRIPSQIKRHACNAAHGLALYHSTDSVIATSCIAFTEMMGKDTNLLGTHLSCSQLMQRSKQFSYQNFKSQLYKVVANKVGAAEELLKMVESSLESQWKEEPKTLQCLQQNQLAIQLTALHDLSPSYIILKFAAKSNNWLLFVLAAQIFQYSLSKVQELIAEFTCAKLREHLYYALALETIQQCDMASIATESLDLTKVKAGPNRCILQCKSELFVNIAQCNNNEEEMLNMSIKVGNPVLALLSSCLKPKSGIRPFCTWLVTSSHLPVTSDTPWTPTKVLEILELSVQLGYIRNLAQAFLIFLPDNPLQTFSTFLVDTVLDKKFQSGILILKTFKDLCVSLPDKTTGRIIGFMKNKNWITEAAVRMASVALVYCFKSVHHQHRYLQVLAESNLSESTPDYALVLRLSNCLAETNISLNYAQLCLHNDHSQLIQQLQLLIEKKDFQTAFRFASTAGLSSGPVHIAEWRERAKTDEGRELGFWSRCQTGLNQALVEPQLAATFFREEATQINNPQGRFILLKYALEWLKKIPAEDKEIYNLQLDMYLTVLQQGFNIEMVTDGITYTPLHYVTTDLERKSESQGVPKLSLEQLYKLDCLIHRLLEVGDIMTVVSLQNMFQHVNQDYELVLACMSIAEGKPVQKLPETIQDLLHIDSISTKPKSLVSSPTYRNQVSVVEKQKLVNYLYALQAHQTCSTPIFRNIINAYKVSSLLGLDYKVILTHPEPLDFLKVEDDFEKAGYVFTLAELTNSELTQYLAEQLTSVIHAGSDSGYKLWGCDLDTQFGRLLSLDGIIPLMLGNLLISSVPRLDSKQPITLKEAVELLIRSHDCFTKACNMEGISSVLTMSGNLVNLLVNCGQWALMVRLLTGVGRYTEMKYIFQILKDRDHFEFLLGKGLDKYPGLMSATLDFVRNDKPYYMLVAVHFCMYSELAVLFKDEATSELEKLERGPDGSLTRSNHNKQCLQTALNKYADATNHYIQANKQKQGVVCVQQAELVALQLSLMTATPSSQNIPCLINLSADQVTNLIMSYLRYEEACVVSAAYNLAVDWSAALYHHCVIQGETAYLNAWCQQNHFTLTIVQEVARRFQNTKTLSASTETNMKWFLSSVDQVDIKYRICSQLGFKDLLQTILSGPDLAYLKDTVWQRGFKYTGLQL